MPNRTQFRTSTQPLDPATVKQALQTMTPVRKDEKLITNAREREALISTSTRARGRLTYHTRQMVAEAARQRGMDSRFPGAFRINRTVVAGVMIMDPVPVYDKNQPDLYEIRWTRGNRDASVNLLEILEPLKLTVTKEYACEIPVSMTPQTDDTPSYMVLHLQDAVIRPISEVDKSQFTDPEQKKKETVKPGKTKGAGAKGEVKDGTKTETTLDQNTKTDPTKSS